MRRRRWGGLVGCGLLALLLWALLRLLRTPATPVAESPPLPPPPAPAAPVAHSARKAPPPMRPRSMHLARRRAGAGVRPMALGAAALVMLVVGAAAAGVGGGGFLGGADPVEPSIGEMRLGDPAGQGVITTWAPVLRASAARSRPSGDAAVAGRLAARTPEGDRNVVVIAEPGATSGPAGWVRVRLPGTPGALGWVARGTLGSFAAVNTEAVVDLTQRTFTLVRRGRVVLQAPVGIGTAAAPTPAGTFYVRSRFGRYRGAFYGPLAFGLSAGAPGLTDWPVEGALGIHGTNRPQLVPGAVSRASIRMRNPDLRRLARLMPVGTPVTVV